MTFKVTKEEVVELLKAGGRFVMDGFGDSLDQVGREAFSQAISIGIENTIAALYDANVEDKEILRVVSEHWGLCTEEVEDRLILEKSQATIRSLKQYLRLQGFTANEINRFMNANHAATKIRHDKDLWKLRNAPQKLMKAIQAE